MLVLRPARMEDAAILFAWRNDPQTRANSLSEDKVWWPEHVAWLRCALDKVLIAEQDGKPVGTVRIETELSWIVAPEHRGRGIGRQMLALVAGTARIKRTNIASQKIAEAAGFSLVEDGEVQLWKKETV
jgi:RimJ/RimL family protein N-acetyltransferase